jgi:hypothetical protein
MIARIRGHLFIIGTAISLGLLLGTVAYAFATGHGLSLRDRFDPSWHHVWLPRSVVLPLGAFLFLNLPVVVLSSLTLEFVPPVRHASPTVRALTALVTNVVFTPLWWLFLSYLFRRRRPGGS